MVLMFVAWRLVDALLPLVRRPVRWMTRHLPLMALLVTTATLAAGEWVAGQNGADVSPDGALGLWCALAGTVLVLASWVGYVARRTLGLRGRLQTWQAWHMTAGVLALALVLAHAAGNAHADRTGTYALAGLLALVLSGVVGRLVDRYATRALSRLPVGEAANRKALGVELVRVWRQFHVLLAGVALGLIAWHITVAVGLLLAGMQSQAH